MNNHELKKEIETLKKRSLDKKEKISLEKELKELKNNSKEKSKLNKLLNTMGKALFKFAKFSNKIISQQVKNQEKKYNKKKKSK